MRPTLEDEWDLEPWDDDPDGVDAHYIRESSEPEIDDEGREIWLTAADCAPGADGLSGIGEVPLADVLASRPVSA